MDLEARIVRLEAQNRRLALALVGAFALLLACAGVTANYALVRVKQLVIVDDDEHPVATLLGSKSGLVFSTVQADGKSRVVLDRSGVKATAP